jgi:hypothetical protein
MEKGWINRQAAKCAKKNTTHAKPRTREREKTERFVFGCPDIKILPFYSFAFFAASRETSLFHFLAAWRFLFYSV